ncbi:hypothetical protein ZOSMA_289G00300 [Zostera marina]|uniref:Uncharacterized protein n=1 Tax=Zostera marina TaxID=29655 RepID=A0A0K9PCT8_ZOSMR|nr:hypothetical protein ZOSMA_289G00300 [Zostera marina]
MENSRNTGEEWKRAEVVSENLRRPLLEVDRIDGEGDESGVDNDGGERNGNENETLDGLFRRFVESIVRPEDPNTPIIRRITVSCVDTAPHLKEASRNTASDVIQWSREGNSPLRALFAISIGTILCLACTALTVFAFFFAIATFNSIVVALFLSVAAAGGLLAIFFVSIAGIYIGALSIAVFFISAITISAALSILVASGWVGFFYLIWIAAKKTGDLTRKSFNMTGSLVSSYATRSPRA